MAESSTTGEESADSGIPSCSSSIYEDESNTDDKRAKPGSIDNVLRVYIGLKKKKREIVHGKWLVFVDLDQLNETWSKIVQAIKHDELEGCPTAKCSTLMYNPSCSGPGPFTYAQISVYTHEHNMDKVGFKLIELVKQDIKYKTEAATGDYKYVHAGSGRCTIKMIYYNNGNPSFKLIGKLCYGMSPCKKDTWQLNIVQCPGKYGSEFQYGQWTLILEYKELTDLWHYLKNKIELEKELFGIVKMLCPPKQDKFSKYEMPVFLVYTTKENMESVGFKLIEIVRRNIFFTEFSSGYAHSTALYWNDGEPVMKYNSGQELLLSLL